MTTLELAPRTPVDSIEELLAGASTRVPMKTADSKSGAAFERVVIDGERFVVKYLHVDDDWIMRVGGDVRCRPLLAWTSGLMDAVPPCIDHTVVGAAAGLGRNGWGAAILMRDVAAWLVPEGDSPIELSQHRGYLDHMAQLHARFWGFRDAIGLTPYSSRWAWFGPDALNTEIERPEPDPVPLIAARGWREFSERAGAADRATAALVEELRHDFDPLVAALATTPSTLVQGDWKAGNLGTLPDGRTILIDWAIPGEGPATNELAWYLAVNAARLPHSKEEAIDTYRAALDDHGIDTAPWFDRQLGLALLGALVQLGWEKSLGSEAELRWWLERARDGARYL